MWVIAKVSVICRTQFLSYWQSLKLNFRTRYDDVTKKGDVPLYDLRKYKSENKGHSLHKKMGVVKKISIKCKALDASPIAHVFSLI